MKLRLEQRSDYGEVENLTREAFWNVYRPGCVEHLIVHRLREDPCFIPELDYVVEADGKLVASIFYAKTELALDAGGTVEAALFGPVSVLPEYQGKGYGTKLISFTLEKAKELGWPAVFITGNPAYYSRFGFETASKHGIHYGGLDRSEEAPFFMVKALNGQFDALRGTYSDPACYVVSDAEAEEFDKQFPPKVKEVLPGQL